MSLLSKVTFAGIGLAGFLVGAGGVGGAGGMPTAAAACTSLDSCVAALGDALPAAGAVGGQRLTAQRLRRIERRAERALATARRRSGRRREVSYAKATAALHELIAVAHEADRQGALAAPLSPIDSAAVTLLAMVSPAAAAVTAPSQYSTFCAGCHGASAEGGFGPNLQCLSGIANAVRNGVGPMPAYSTAQLSDAEVQVIQDWLLGFCAPTTTTTQPPVTTTSTTRPPATTTSTTRPPATTTSTTRPPVTTTSTTRPPATTTSTTRPPVTTTSTTRPPVTTTSTTLPPLGGAALYADNCGFCHGDPATPGPAPAASRKVPGARACSIAGSIDGTAVFPGGVPAMRFLRGRLGAAQIQAIAAYLNSFPVSGQQRYVTACAGCHAIDATGGPVDVDVRGAGGSETREAILEEQAMRFLGCLPTSDTNAIGSYLGTLEADEDGDDGHGDEDEHRSEQQQSED